GPVALDMSRHWIRCGWEAARGVELRVSFAPGLSTEDLHAEWLAEARRSPQRKAANLLGAWVPQRLAAALVRDAGLDADLTLGRATRDERGRLVAAVGDARLPVTGAVGYGKAEVTAGGVALDEVVGRSLESKLQPGLFFAG